MCGISGIINFNYEKIKTLDLESMMLAMKHRGPDDQGIFINENIGLGFVRLSIIDLSVNGHQPFQSDDNRYTIVFNGEIFNYIELRDELLGLGVIFKTKTDTEVLLKSYIHWGEECLNKFNGMWAFAIYDKIENKLFCSRDRFGIKPFYYYKSENTFYFASEISAILKVLNEKPEANNQIIYEYLVYNKTDHNNQTFFKKIYKLMHGHSILLNLNSAEHITPKRWYDLKEKVSTSIGFNNPSEYKEFLKNAVKLRLRSDVPVGVCLSGGLDSSSIVSISIDELKIKNLNTFSMIFNQNFKEDEANYIRLYDEKPGTRNFVTPTASSLIQDFDDFINTHCEPTLDGSNYGEYKIMQLVKTKTTVVLDGQGADEQLAGYHYFFGIYYKELLLKLNWITLFKEIFYYLKIHKSFFALKTFIFFLIPKKIRNKLITSKADFFDKEFLNKFKVENIIIEKLYGSDNLKEAFLNHFEYKLEHHLKSQDRNSMRFSVESRVPFLDYNLVEKTIATPSKFLIKNGITKNILRKSMKNLLPNKICNRVDKIGYSTPQDQWFRDSLLMNFTWDIINSNRFKDRQIFDVEKTRLLFKNHTENKSNSAKELWKIINLELWFRKYID